MRSSCCRESPSLLAAGKLGDDDFDPSPPIPLPLNCKQFEPCGELASPNITQKHKLTFSFSAAIRIFFKRQQKSMKNVLSLSLTLLNLDRTFDLTILEIKIWQNH